MEVINYKKDAHKKFTDNHIFFKISSSKDYTSFRKEYLESYGKKFDDEIIFIGEDSIRFWR